MNYHKCMYLCNNPPKKQNISITSEISVVSFPSNPCLKLDKLSIFWYVTMFFCVCLDFYVNISDEMYSFLSVSFLLSIANEFWRFIHAVLCILLVSRMPFCEHFVNHFFMNISFKHFHVDILGHLINIFKNL